MSEEAAAKVNSLLGYYLENLALVKGEAVAKLKPLRVLWWLNVLLPIALLGVVTLGLHPSTLRRLEGVQKGAVAVSRGQGAALSACRSGSTFTKRAPEEYAP